MKDVFEFDDYKSYLTAVLGQKRQRKGERARLAQFLNCQMAHISQVLNGHTHFSLEQGIRINAFLGHDREESQYFTLLLHRDRAGTDELRRYYSAQMEEIQQRRSRIKNRVETTKTIPPEFQSRYYSSWHYVAIHVALALPALRTKASLAEYFNLSVSTVANALEFLTSLGLAELQSGEYIVGKGHVHLGDDSDNINKHHANWRIQAVDSLGRAEPATHLHYSVVYSLSKKDAARIREKIMDVISENLAIVAPSPEETIYCSTIDFFPLKKSPG